MFIYTNTGQLFYIYIYIYKYGFLLFVLVLLTYFSNELKQMSEKALISLRSTCAHIYLFFLFKGSQYEFKDSPGIQHAGFPHASFYPYGHQYQFGDPSRPKNAMRESTSTLKAWLSEHRKNPYPTKGEKIMLAIITKMTLTQVSTWFANARRRLKKENKMTWVPKASTDEEGHVYTSDNEDGDKRDEDEENRPGEHWHGKHRLWLSGWWEISVQSFDSEEYDDMGAERGLWTTEETKKLRRRRGGPKSKRVRQHKSPQIMWVHFRNQRSGSLAETATAPDSPRKSLLDSEELWCTDTPCSKLDQNGPSDGFNQPLPRTETPNPPQTAPCTWSMESRGLTAYETNHTCKDFFITFLVGAYTYYDQRNVLSGCPEFI